MTQKLRFVNGRAMIGLGLAVWVILVFSGSLRAQASGPEWGLYLTHTSDGRTVVESIDAKGAAWPDGVRPHDEILAIGGQPAALFDGRTLPTSVHEIAFRDAAGLERTAQAADMSVSVLAILITGALLFAVLGALVYRWSAEPMQGRLFLLLTASFATAVAATPAGRLGYAWANCLTPSAALVAAPSLFGLFLAFPRPMRNAKKIVSASLMLAILLVFGQLGEESFGPSLAPEAVAILDNVSWLWMTLNLLGAIALIAVRASRRADRTALAPLLLGTTFGVAPIVALVAVPRVLGMSSIMSAEVAIVAMAAIPMSFAYSILRHQVFGLDVVMRRVVLRISGALIAVAMFFAEWLLLQSVGLPATGAALLSVVLTSLAIPPVTAWTRDRLDQWLYRPLYSVRSQALVGQVDGLDNLGGALTQRARELLPIQWAACVVHDDTTPTNNASRRLLGADGQLPLWLDSGSPLDQSPTEVTVTPIHHFDTGAVLLLAGPRLDGDHLDGIQSEAMRGLAQAVAPRFEAGLLRERAEDEARFRQGLTDLARDLAAAAAVKDVLRSFLTHAARLLYADSASLWRQGPDGEVALVDKETFGGAPGAEVVRALIDRRPAHDHERDWVAITTDGASLGIALDDGADEPIVCLVRRIFDPSRFGTVEEGRARELAEHTTGALRRAAERENLEEQLRHRAFYDSLTALPNRALFLDRIAHAIARGERNGQELAVLFIDLDRFKVVNDSLGHSAGDELLVQVGHRLRSCLRESDTIARLGGDEFTVLLEGQSATIDAAHAAQRILSTLREPFVLDGQEMYASASIGISGGSAVRDSGRDLLR